MQIFGNAYYHKELEPLHGEQVQVGYDIHDADKVWVRDLEGRLVCVAAFEGNKSAYMPLTAAQAAHERRTAGRLRRIDAHRQEIMAEAAAPKVIEHQPAAPGLPAITLPAATPVTLSRGPAPVGAAERAAQAKVVQVLNAAPAPAADPRAARLERAFAIEIALAEGRAVSDENREWFEKYRDLPEFRAERRLRDAFRLTA